MRIANLRGRLVMIARDGQAAVDVEHASNGRFSANPQLVYRDWGDFVAWAGTVGPPAGQPFELEELGPPVPAPRQVFAIGLNYREHASEAGFAVPEAPVVFTKWPSCLTGPITNVELPAGGHTDWEVELVAVIGRAARHVAPARAWTHVAGLTIGQDLSERMRQFTGPSPQFSMAKSLPGFGPTGPYLVTIDEFDDPDDLALECALNGVSVQNGRTGDLIFSVPDIIARLSAALPLYPGDIIFTGTPPGVGMGRSPQQYVAAGDELVSRIAGIGELRQRFVPAQP